MVYLRIRVASCAQAEASHCSLQACFQDATRMSRLHMPPQGSWPLCLLTKIDMKQLDAGTISLLGQQSCGSSKRQTASQGRVTSGERAAGATWGGAQGVGRGRVNGAGGRRHPRHVRAAGCGPHAAPPRSRRPAPARQTVAARSGGEGLPWPSRRQLLQQGGCQAVCCSPHRLLCRLTNSDVLRSPASQAWKPAQQSRSFGDSGCASKGSSIVNVTPVMSWRVTCWVLPAGSCFA